MILLTDHELGTFEKVLLQDWTVIRDMIIAKTKFVKEQIHADTDDQSAIGNLLTDIQLNNALNGPFQTFFKHHLAAYAKIAHVTMALSIFKGEVLKRKDFDGEVDYGIPETALTHHDFSTLKQARQSLDTMTQDHMMLLTSQIEAWSEILLTTLQQNDLPLNDIEIQNFLANETITEINERLIDLKIELPKLKKTDLNFTQYYQLKLTITIHSALSRMHQPNTNKEIQNILQHCKKSLKHILQAENQLHSEQQTELDSITTTFMTA